MKGITVAKPGAAPEVSTDLKVPELSDDQILVKSIYTAVNPVYVHPQVISPYYSLDAFRSALNAGNAVFT